METIKSDLATVTKQRKGLSTHSRNAICFSSSEPKPYVLANSKPMTRPAVNNFKHSLKPLGLIIMNSFTWILLSIGDRKFVQVVLVT